MFRKKRKDPLRAMLYSLASVRKALSRMEALSSRIASRRQYLLEKAFQLEEMGNSFLARKYIEEAERLKGFLERIYYIKLVLEKLSLTLELNIEMKRFDKDAKEILEIIGILKKLPESTIPEFALALHEIEVGIREVADSSIAETIMMNSYSVSTSSDAEKILAEARAIAQEKLLNELSTPNK